MIERYYSRSKKRVFEGELPPGYSGSQFGPSVRTFCQMLYYQGRVPSNKIFKILTGMGILISEAKISRIVTDLPESLAKEKEEAKDAAIRKSGYLQVDDTGAKISGKSGHTIVSCNKYFTDFYTSYSKSRFSVIRLLSGSHVPLFCLNEAALRELDGRISKKYMICLLKKQSEGLYLEQEFKEKVLAPLVSAGLPQKSREDLLSVCASIGYHKNDNIIKPIVLLSDDATNFKSLISLHALCWVHEIRHYRVLNFSCAYHKEIMDKFIGRLWRLYRKIKRYKKKPEKLAKISIVEEFDLIFKTESAFKPINYLQGLTYAKRDRLLLVLDHPFIPLHNNESETDLRERVIKRRISYGNRSTEGIKAWDTYLALMHTCRKLGVSFWSYLQDRILQLNHIPCLAEIIDLA